MDRFIAFVLGAMLFIVLLVAGVLIISIQPWVDRSPIPAIVVKEINESGRSYLDVIMYENNGAKVEDLRFVSGTDGEDSVPPSFNRELMLNTTYRFKAGGADPEHSMAYATVNGKERKVIDYTR